MWVPRDRAEQVREILTTRGLTLHHVSRRSAELFGRTSQFFIPHNLYSDLARTASTPTIFQVLTLSHITNHRLTDWLRVFGFDLDAILGLGLAIPRRRTTILDSAVYDIGAWIPWFAERIENGPVSPITPLGQVLTLAAPRRASELLGLNRRTFLYARIGDQDFHALPYFLPGSVVRVDTQLGEVQFGRSANGEGRFFLVEHEFGWTCSRLTLLTKERVLLHCQQRPGGERELQIGKNARILGVIDAEIRPLARDRRPGDGMAQPGARRKSQCNTPGEKSTLPGLLRRARLRMGLTLRDASSTSRRIAETLSNEQYFAAASTLSDYEALPGPPRQIEKIVTLCVLYSIGFEEFLRASGLPLDRAGREEMPDELVPKRVPGRKRGVPMAGQDDPKEPSGFLAALVKQWEEIPLFLRHSLDEITGLKNLSFMDVFWVGGDQAQLHPLLANATFIVVNRRARKPPTEDALCEQPLYLILRRDGSYLCGRCTFDKGSLMLHDYPRGAADTRRFRNGTDAEVVGQVTTILRRLP